MNEFIAWLDSGVLVSTSIAGGKGSSLAVLSGAGFPVPPAFAVTADAYRTFQEAVGLSPLVRELSFDGAPSLDDVTTACSRFADYLASASLPASISEPLTESFSALAQRSPAGASFVARSSATSEDSATASFAGLYETYLNLHSCDQVLDATVNCYRCLWQPRAVHYRATRHMDHAQEAMAVVVMPMIPSAVAGVAFTVNPVTGADDEVLITASWGLGEAVVSGIVTPDTFILGKDGELRMRDVATKVVRIMPDANGTHEEPVPAELANTVCLDEDQLGQVQDAAVAVERHYGRPMDIEFAFDGDGRFYLLQARPITTV